MASPTRSPGAKKIGGMRPKQKSLSLFLLAVVGTAVIVGVNKIHPLDELLNAILACILIAAVMFPTIRLRCLRCGATLSNAPGLIKPNVMAYLFLWAVAEKCWRCGKAVD